ncbi:MAG: hypothetical protein WC655_17350, partial [Candidatus Hydrogenedentales bacterium]|jgi:hypothetical protein
MVELMGSYMGMIPMMTLGLMQYSQQWQAADVFRAAPMPGPAPLCHGARKAVMCVIALPLACIFAAIAWAVQRDAAQMLLLLPGIVAMPVFGVAAGLNNGGVPLSMPTEEAKGASRGLMMMGIMMSSFAISGVAGLAWATGWFHWFMLGECVFGAALYAAIHVSLARKPWPQAD